MKSLIWLGVIVVALASCTPFDPQTGFRIDAKGLRGVVAGDAVLQQVAQIDGELGAGTLYAIIQGREGCMRLAVILHRQYALDEGQIVVLLDAFGSVSQSDDERAAFQECAMALAAMSPPVIVVEPQ